MKQAIAFGENKKLMHGAPIVSITVGKGTYLILGYNGSTQPAWFNGVTDAESHGYTVVSARESFIKIQTLTFEKNTISLVNLAGADTENHGSTYICAIRIDN